ncbi:MAG: hypothetical protein ACERKD_04105 [Prolixibacteraceae bacterium]
MKQLFIIGFLISILLSSCLESDTSVFSVNDEELSASANGTMVIYIDQEGEPFTFTGNLKLLDGECQILLLAPILDTLSVLDSLPVLDRVYLPDSVFVDSVYVSGLQYVRDTILDREYVAPVNITFDEQFSRILGEWEFSYEMLPVDKVEPDGNFEFTFSYAN